ncbi:MAG: FG-GAP-like repeat-containing protein [Bryobacteraceae bacterium]
MNTVDDILKLPALMLEMGLTTAHNALGEAQRVVEKVAGQSRQHLTAPPLNGPSDLDTAVSEFMNHIARIARYTPKDTAHLPAASKEILDAAKKSFGFLDLTSPAALTLPVQFTLSFATLMTQSALRGLVTYDVMGSSRIQRLMTDFYDMFTELQVFVGLEYKEIIERCKERLKEAPDDHAIRLELGENYVKCGLYDEATEVLLQVPRDDSYYALARHEAAVAFYRSGRFEKAAQADVDALHADPADERARCMLWLSVQKLGGYPAFVPESHRMEMKVGYEKPTVEFEDIAAKIGLDKTSAGRGVAVFDYDNDGFLDIVIASAHGGCNLYHNNGDGTYTDVSINSGLDSCVNGFAITVGDFNNDGYPDLFITRLGFYVGEGQLFRNNGDGTFTDVTKQAGVKVWGPAFTASWVDYDGDGFLDLFIANNLGGLFERKTPNRLFHNNGDGTFTEVTDEAGLKTIWPTIGGAWGDYNNDGRPDLFLSNGLGRSQLYENNGDGTFTDVSERAGVTALGFGSPAFWWDFDNDGWMDIAQFVWSDHEDVIHTMKTGHGPADGNPMRVYRNNRDGTFTQVNAEIGLTGCWGTMSGNAGDFNNDGYLDVVLGNGSPKMDRMEPMILLENDGKKFHNITFAAGLPFTGKSHGVNLADLFGDGRMSILVAAGGAYPGDLLTTGVYYPKRLAGNYLNVRLVGVKSNRSAIGAKVSISAGGRAQYRELSGGSNFGCLPLEQHFGLADIQTVDSLDIRWPSGLQQHFENLPLNSTIEFTEGQEGWRDVYAEAKKALKRRSKKPAAQPA